MWNRLLKLTLQARLQALRRRRRGAEGQQEQRADLKRRKGYGLRF